MNRLDHDLISILCAMHDPIGALTDCPSTPEDWFLAERVKKLLDRVTMTDSTIDDLMDMALTHAPITMRARSYCNYAPTDSTTIDFTRGLSAIVDYSLN